MSRSPEPLPLIAYLEQYEPWNAVEAAHYQAMLSLLHAHPVPFDRQCYEPGHITASTWILAEDTGQVALIYHRAAQRWLQPGGHPEAGECDGLSTALREAKEELGLEIERSRAALFDLDVHSIPATATQPKHQHFDLRYLCWVTHQPLSSGSDAADARWFTMVELEAIGLTENMKRMLDKGSQGLKSV